MEFSLSGNALKTFSRSITCLARIGNELAIQASSSQLAFHTLNSSRSAYQSITFKPDFFDVYTVSGSEVQCSVLLKAICSVLRTPLTSIDHLSMLLPDRDASKVQWTLDCYSGMRKAYWITCNEKFPSNFVVRPRDLNRLLSNFQSTLQEITIIATETTSLPSDVANELEGKLLNLEVTLTQPKNDSSLHTQLWIDPTEEFVQYTHKGNPVDITFGVKELKLGTLMLAVAFFITSCQAFLSFCEGCEVDIHLYFDKAGEPILMAPKFGFDDSSTSNLDATLVLATMLMSQLHEGNPLGPSAAAATTQAQACGETRSQPHERTRGIIWSDLSGSGAKNGNGIEARQVEAERNPVVNEQREIQRISTMHISKDGSSVGNTAGAPNFYRAMEAGHRQETQERAQDGSHYLSQRHPSNWVDADEDEEEGDETELCVQSTPPYNEE
ncbi:Exodeoxyribonuclease III [Bertholletia excelsa]